MITRKLFALFTCMLTTLCIFSQTGFKLATGNQKDEIKKEIVKSSKNTRTLYCDFVQTKKMSLLSEDFVSRGAMYYKYDNKLVWRYDSPYKYEFVINGDIAIMKNDGVSTQFNSKSNKMANAISKIMISLVNGSGIGDNINFEETYFVNSNECKIKLIPKGKELKKLFSTINIIFSNVDYTANNIEMIEDTGDSTTIKLINKQLNKELGDNIFKTK